MKTKRILSFVLTAMVVLAIGPLAWGSLFVNPPENNPNITWETQYPYQRNIMMDFDTTNPVCEQGPIPGAVYEGYDDPELWDSDSVTMNEYFQWDQTTGSIGNFEPGYYDDYGRITFHLDNWERPWPVKHVYVELVYKRIIRYYEQEFGQHFITPSGTNQYTKSWSKVDDLGGGSYRLSRWVEFQPNQPWEEPILYVTDPYDEPQAFYLDSVHIATECVPEPATVCLLGFGALGLLKKRRT
jgi:hypothetical protein